VSNRSPDGVPTSVGSNRSDSSASSRCSVARTVPPAEHGPGLQSTSSISPLVSGVVRAIRDAVETFPSPTPRQALVAVQHVSTRFSAVVDVASRKSE
jgi:hypothetical protein